MADNSSSEFQLNDENNSLDNLQCEAYQDEKL